jgi:CheY-like chemotaxis protein
MAVDPGQLQQVLINLCINARDAMRGPGQLEIRTRRVEPTQLPPRIKGEGKDLPLIEIAVRDTGCGMDANILRQVFDPFFTTKAKDQGTGLGLAIVYRIVQAHGGTIEVNSIPGQGTEFRVYLPQAQADVSEPAEQPQVHGTEQILVVDDEVMIASLLRTVLERSGYEVKVAHDANEAIAIAEQSDKPIDLTVMDYSLPGMTGDCCLARLREKWPKLAAVIITGHPVDNHELSVNNARILAKPFTSTAITQAVRETLHG